jgi:hypothetical protein
MGRTARERLASPLDDTEAPGSFSAQILAPADTLQVKVADSIRRAGSSTCSITITPSGA